MHNLTAYLTVDMLTAWHLGTGKEGGAYADTLAVKDAAGLPVLSGKSLKGLLRAACKESYRHQWLSSLDENSLNQLFGSEGNGLFNQGAIEVSSATLSEAEQAYFQQHPESIKFLYRVDHHTSIDKVTGAAKDGSLRSMESVVPMQLTASIHITTENQETAELFYEWVAVSLPLITAVGGKRRRGFGEAILTISKEAQ